jgi:hypothetical protein
MRGLKIQHGGNVGEFSLFGGQLDVLARCRIPNGTLPPQ